MDIEHVSFPGSHFISHADSNTSESVLLGATIESLTYFLLVTLTIFHCDALTVF